MTKQDLYNQPTIVEGFEETAAAEPSTAEVPKKIGPYTIEKLLHQSELSVLYLAKDPDSGNTITVKTLSQKYLQNKEMVNRFTQEADIIALADHPNIVGLYGHGQWEKGLYIAMEFVEGTLLKKVMLEEKLTLKRALEIILEVAYALCHLHSNGVTHRDLKPENILITPEGKIKVIDFGIAQLLNIDPKEMRITQHKRFMGTPVYMSPEQKENPASASYPSDIYSLAIIAYECVLGQLSNGILHINLLPPGLQGILTQALKPSLDERYTDIVDFIMDLTGYLKGSDLADEAAALKDVSVPKSPSPASTPTPTPTPAPAPATQPAPVKEEKNEEPASDTVKEVQEEPEAKVPESNPVVDELHEVQERLLPPSLPDWRDMELGQVIQLGDELGGVYYDFFELKGGAFGFIMGEPTTTGATGFVYSSNLRGMVRSLSWSASKPVELVAYLNDLLTKDPMDEIFTLSYLIMDPDEDEFHYISCGYGLMWQVASSIEEPRKILVDNIALGISDDVEFQQLSCEWNVGDTLVLNTFRAIGESFTEEDFKKSLSQHKHLNAQDQADALYGDMTSKVGKEVEDRVLNILSIQRKG